MESDPSCYSGPEPQILPFPLELLVRILSYLDQISDKKNARLVCKGFAAAGLCSLTSTVYFSTSLIKVGYHSTRDATCSSPTREIAMHPVVSKYITKLVCDGTQLLLSHLDLGAFQSWWAMVGNKNPSWPILEIRSIYAIRHREEDWITRTGQDQKIFRTALERFVNLKCMVFTDVAADESWTFPRTPRPTWPSALPKGDLWGPTSPYHTFAMCIRSLSEMAIKLSELHIEGRPNAISHCMFAHASAADCNHLLNVFANLRKISVNVSTHHDTHPPSFDGLGRFLTHATMVQSLDLKCIGTQGYSHRPSRLTLSRLFQNVTWPHLKHFGLHGVAMNTDVELITFFGRHQATLDSVALRDVLLHERDLHSMNTSPCEAWKQFFGELRKRSIKFQSLDLFWIHDCCNFLGGPWDLAAGTDYGKKVLRYLHEGGVNPLASVTTSEAGI